MIILDIKDVRNGMNVQTSRRGMVRVDNALYILNNVLEAGQDNMEAGLWIDLHPHIDNVKEDELTDDYKDKARKRLREKGIELP